MQVKDAFAYLLNVLRGNASLQWGLALEAVSVIIAWGAKFLPAVTSSGGDARETISFESTPVAVAAAPNEELAMASELRTALEASPSSPLVSIFGPLLLKLLLKLLGV